MSGEMVPPQYSPSNAARSFTIRGRAKCPRRRARSFDEGVTVSRPSAVGRDVIVTLYTESNFSFRLLVCGSSIDTQLCCLHEATISLIAQINAACKNHLQAVFSYERRNGSFSILPLRHDKRSLTARGRAKCPRRRARSFDEGITKSREKRGFARRLSSFYSLEQSFVFAFSCGFLKPKNNASNRNGDDCKCNRRRYSYSLFSVFP